jgi:hypothetical protein
MKTKKIIPLLLLLFFVSAYSQSTDNKKNIIKTNLTGYIFRNYNLTYERSLTSWLSIAVSYGKIPEGEIPFSKQFLEEDDAAEFGLDKVQFSNTQLTIEPRFYLGKGYGRGFYFAPYYRQTKMQIDNLVYNMYFENDDFATPVTLSGKMNGNGFGLMLGSQWTIGKKNNWVIDWWIAGAHYGNSDGYFDGISDRVLTPQEQVELQEALEGIDLSVANFETTITTNARGAKMSLTGPWIGLRSGLSFGYRF